MVFFCTKLFTTSNFHYQNLLCSMQALAVIVCSGFGPSRAAPIKPVRHSSITLFHLLSHFFTKISNFVYTFDPVFLPKWQRMRWGSILWDKIWSFLLHWLFELRGFQPRTRNCAVCKEEIRVWWVSCRVSRLSHFYLQQILLYWVPEKWKFRLFRQMAMETRRQSATIHISLVFSDL